MIEREKVLQHNLNLSGYAQEVSLEEIKEILKQARTKGYFFATSATMYDGEAQTKAHFKIYNP